MATKSAKPRKKRTPRGNVGVEIFEQVEKLMSGENVGRTEAFRRLAKTTGRQMGTVAANYYRIARRRGTKLAPRRRRGASAGTSSSVVNRAMAALDDVGGMFRKLEEEIVALRKENQRLAAIRRLVAR